MIAQMFGKSEAFTKPIKKGNPELENMSDFQIVMILCNQDDSIKINLNNFFELIFPAYDVKVNERDLTFSLKNENGLIGMINDFNYTGFLN